VIEVYISTERLLSIVPKSLGGGLALGISAGFVLPTCECGVVPIVRRLINKGVPPYIAIAYMLAAPIVNPVVLASTYIAFRGSFTMVIARVALAILVAAIVGLISKKIVKVVRTTADESSEESHSHDHGHNHHHHHQTLEHRSGKQKIKEALIHAAYEFMDMGKFLILGAIIAAAFKTFLPENIMAVFSGSLTLSILGMMILAVLLSVCSEADAFVAASFVGFPMVSQLAFIAIGPMVDLKLIGMFGITFSRRMVLVLVFVPFVLIFLASLLIAQLGIF
jgi:uncharacterized membrane protein YraQ (UPF0718 family)